MSSTIDPLAVIRRALEARRAEVDRKFADADAARAAAEEEARRVKALAHDHELRLIRLEEMKLNRKEFCAMVEDARAVIDSQLHGVVSYLVGERAVDREDHTYKKPQVSGVERRRILGSYDLVVQNERLLADAERVLNLVDEAISDAEADVAEFIKSNGL
jgi:hypothetical protein